MSNHGRRLRLTAVMLGSVAAISLVAGSGVVQQGRAANPVTTTTGSPTHAWPGESPNGCRCESQTAAVPCGSR